MGMAICSRVAGGGSCEDKKRGSGDGNGRTKSETGGKETIFGCISATAPLNDIGRAAADSRYCPPPFLASLEGRHRSTPSRESLGH